MLAEHGRVIYVTYRKLETEELTRQWLAAYSFRRLSARIAASIRMTN